MSDNDQTWLVCISTDAPRTVPSRPAFCFRCGGGIWVSDAMWPLVTLGEGRPVCAGCAVKIAEAEPDHEYQVHARQEQELADLGILDFARTMVDELNQEKRG